MVQTSGIHDLQGNVEMHSRKTCEEMSVVKPRHPGVEFNLYALVAARIAGVGRRFEIPLAGLRFREIPRRDRLSPHHRNLGESISGTGLSFKMLFEQLYGSGDKFRVLKSLRNITKKSSELAQIEKGI